MSNYKDEFEVLGSFFSVPLIDIYVDEEFNCRGHFSALSVDDLARSIDQKGLNYPLDIQPMRDVPPFEQPNPCPWRFRLIAGHRRYMAVNDILCWDKAPCRIREGLSHEDAHALNFTENLERNDLNMLQEAVGLQNTWPGLPASEIKKRVKRDERWIRVRQKLMTLPEEVQMAAASERISQYDVESLATVEPEAILVTLQQIIASKGKSGKAPVIPGRQGWRKSRARSKTELGEMVTFLYEYKMYTCLSDKELALVNSVLAWASRGINTEEFLIDRLDIPAECVTVDADDRKITMKEE